MDERRGGLCRGIFLIDTYMLPSKITYFVASAAFNHKVYITIFLTSVGLTSVQVGTIFAMACLSTAVMSPIWGLIADHTRRRRLIFLILCVGATCSKFAMPWVAAVISRDTRKTNLTQVYAGNNNLTVDTDKYSTISKTNLTPPSSATLFYAMSLLYVFAEVFAPAIESMVNSLVVKIVENCAHPVSLGSQRAFDSIAYGLTNLLAGTVSDVYQIPGTSKYATVFIVFLVFQLLVIPCGLVLFRQAKWATDDDYVKISRESNELTADEGTYKNDEEIEQTDEKLGQIDALKDVFSKIDNIIFVLTVFTVGLIRHATIPFLFILMKDETQASHSAMGLAMFFGPVAEFIVYPFTNKLIKTVGGPLRAIQISLLSLLMRIILSSYVKNQWLYIIPQLFSGPCHALFWASSIEYNQLISRKEIHVTMYTILTSLYYGVAAAIGGVLGGYLYHVCGGTILYRLTAVFGALWSIISFQYFQLFPFLRKKFTQN